MLVTVPAQNRCSDPQVITALNNMAPAGFTVAGCSSREFRVELKTDDMNFSTALSRRLQQAGVMDPTVVNLGEAVYSVSVSAYNADVVQNILQSCGLELALHGISHISKCHRFDVEASFYSFCVFETRMRSGVIVEPLGVRVEDMSVPRHPGDVLPRPRPSQSSVRSQPQGGSPVRIMDLPSDASMMSDQNGILRSQSGTPTQKPGISRGQAPLVSDQDTRREKDWRRIEPPTHTVDRSGADGNENESRSRDRRKTSPIRELRRDVKDMVEAQVASQMRDVKDEVMRWAQKEMQRDADRLDKLYSTVGALSERLSNLEQNSKRAKSPTTVPNESSIVQAVREIINPMLAERDDGLRAEFRMRFQQRDRAEQATTDIMNQIPTRRQITQLLEELLDKRNVKGSQDGSVSADTVQHLSGQLEKVESSQRSTLRQNDEKLDDLLRRVAALTGTVEALKEEHRETHTTMTGRTESLRSALNDVEMTVKDLGRDFAMHDGEVHKLKAALEALRDQVPRTSSGDSSTVEAVRTSLLQQIRQLEADLHGRTSAVELKAQERIDRHARELHDLIHEKDRETTTRLERMQQTLNATQEERVNHMTNTIRATLREEFKADVRVAQYGGTPVSSISQALTPMRPTSTGFSAAEASGLLSPKYEEMEMIKSYCNRNTVDITSLRNRIRQLELVQAEVAQLLNKEQEYQDSLQQVSLRVARLERRAN